ncbi:MAG TPA: DUF669 domain-containing protein [Pyrinomonadaceae bacterium]|nr:DUF669 domain-containing protein [Pyrinomonadaceae bacterium]
MPIIEPELSEATPSELPAGTYKAHIVDAEQKTSQAGKPYLRWQLTVFDASDARLNGMAVWTSTPTTGRGVFRLQQLYKAATGTALEGRFDTTDLMGKQVLITVVPGVTQDGTPSGYPEVKAIRAVV